MSISIHRNYEYNNVVLLEVPNTEEYHIGSYSKKFYGHYCEGNKIGKEYDIDGQLIFEGKYLDDKRWNGIIYSNGFLFIA